MFALDMSVSASFEAQIRSQSREAGKGVFAYGDVTVVGSVLTVSIP